MPMNEFTALTAKIQITIDAMVTQVSDDEPEIRKLIDEMQALVRVIELSSSTQGQSQRTA